MATTDKVENPSAFPFQETDRGVAQPEYGMTLRDWFAGQALAVIRAARSLIADERRWVKGQFAIGDCMCAVGALIVADGKSMGMTYAAELAVTLGSASPHWADVTSFNDHPARTHADVLSLFDRTAARLEGAITRATGSTAS